MNDKYTEIAFQSVALPEYVKDGQVCVRSQC